MLSSSCGAMTNKEPTATAPSYLRAVMGTMPTPVVAKRSRFNAELAFMNRLVDARRDRGPPRRLFLHVRSVLNGEITHSHSHMHLTGGLTPWRVPDGVRTDC